MDIKTAVIDSNDDDGLKMVNDLLDYIEKHKDLEQKAEGILSSHKDPNAIVTDCNFVNIVPLFKENPYAIALLDYIIGRMNPHNNTFSVNKKGFCKEMHWTKARINKAIQDLIDFGCIRILKNHSKYSSTVYEVNSDIAHYGNYDNAHKFYLCEDVHKGGRPLKYNNEFYKAIVLEYETNSIRQIAANHNVSKSTIVRWLKEGREIIANDNK